MKRLAVITMVLALWLTPALAIKTGVDAPAKPAGKKIAAPEGDKKAVVWRKSIKDARAVAAAEYRPIFVLFTSPDCVWCGRLKAGVFTNPEVAELLAEYSLAEIDIARDPATADRYQVRGVPAMMVMSSDGEVKMRMTGYLPVAEMKRALRQALNPDFLKAKTASYTELLDALDANNVESNKWAEIMIQLGMEERRRELQTRIVKLEPQPKETLVNLLSDERISVRLGALELIEEMTGRDWGFDPWRDSIPAESNAVALAKLKEWAGEKAGSTLDARSVYSALTKEQILAQVQDLVSEDTERSARAMRILQIGGANVLEVLGGFLDEHKDLPVAPQNRIREVRYIIALKECGGLDASSVARRLLHGTTDIRIKAISELQRGGLQALPVLREFIEDRDPIVREAVVEGMIAAGGWRAVSTIKEHLAKEKDKDVVFSALKNLGNVQGSLGVSVLNSYLANENEDLVVAALTSLAKLKSAKSRNEIGKCLADPRWRVRVAALDAAGALKLMALSGEVWPLLKDKDSYVRYAAVKALASISDKNAKSKLEEAFTSDETLMGPVVSAFGRMDLKLPKTFYDGLKDKSPALILEVLEAMDDCEAADLWLAEKFLQDKNLDISCAAIRLVAGKGMSLYANRALVADILKKGRKEQVLAALETFRIDHDELGKVRMEIMGRDAGKAAAAEPGGKPDGVIDGLLDAFTGGDTPAPAAPKPPQPAAPQPAGRDNSPKPAVEPPKPEAPKEETKAAPAGDDIFSAFLEESGETKAGTNAPAGGDKLRGDWTEFVQVVEERMEKTDDKDIRFRAALLLVRLGSSKAIPVLEKEVSSRGIEDRLTVAESFESADGKKTLPIVKILLKDTSEEVRKAAAEMCIQSVNAKDTTLLGALFAELGSEGTLLKPHDIPLAHLDKLSEAPAAKKIVGEWARGVLKGKSAIQAQNLALILLEYCWKEDDLGLVSEFTKSTDPWQRRAAYHALGKWDKDSFTNYLDRVVSDPSEYVRIVAPAIYSRQSGRWIDYIDREHIHESRYFYDYDWADRYDQKKAISPEARKALQKLTADESPNVRVEAFFALLSNKQPVDLFQFVKTLESFPDQRAITSRVEDFLSSNYQSLGQGFVVLVPFIERGGRYDYVYERVSKHFKIDPDKGTDALTVLLRQGATNAIAATYVEPPAGFGARTNERPSLVYFTTPGCPSCEKVERQLAKLRERVKGLEVETHNIRKLSGIRLNEVLSERLGVPTNQRLIAPAVFGGGGYLIKTEISEPALRDLVERSTGIPRSEWREVTDQELVAADKVLDKRGDTAMGFGVVCIGGLVDGVNPCAFATIIFMLSYLQVAKRTVREMIMVGLSFILAVFLTYFAMSLGLMEIVMKAKAAISWFRMALNFCLGAFSLVIMILSIRDGMLCLKGRLGDITLQLPDVLKSGIHGVIRHGVRQSHFVIAAFAIGVAISALELACTGQMLLPMIGYMMEKGQNVRGAMGYLLVYNLMFILPLVAVFALSIFGLSNEALIKWMRRHAAAVKFSTAALFLALFLFFVFGDQIKAWMQ